MPLLPDVPFGSSYYPPHHDPADWPRDLDRMAAAGLTVIRTAELLASWDRIEVARHRYEFGWLDRIFDLAAERGIRVLLGTGSQNPPIWMLDEWPDLPVKSRDGTPYPTATMWGWACKDHPGYRAEVDRWVRVLAGRYADRPNLLGWQIDNEPGYPFIPWRRDAMDLYCYCEHTEVAWRDWLRVRYGDLDALSDAWRWDPTHHRYSAWSQVRAPRSMPVEWGVVTAWLDWRSFTAERLADFVGAQSELLHQLSPGHPTSTNVFIWSRHDAFGVQMGMDPWRLAGRVDAIGYDLYPSIDERFLREPEYVAMYLDYARSCAGATGSELWLNEIESGPLNGWVLGPDHDTTAADITRINADVLGAGSRLTLYQGYREWDCIPIHWGALVDLHGEPTARYTAAGAVARAAVAETDLLRDAEPRPPAVAILIDVDNAVVCQGMAAGEVLLDCVRGAYRALHGFEVGFVTPAEVAGCPARLLVLPFAMVLAASTGVALAAYVERGGHLLSFAKAGMLDGRGWYHRTRPGAGLAELLGVVEADIASTAEPVPVELPGVGMLYGGLHRQRLRPVDGATVVRGRFPDGAPALTSRRQGAGVAWACGTHLDLGVLRYGDPGFLGWLARSAGARPLWSAEPAADGLPRMWARCRWLGDRALVTVTSTDAAPRIARVAVAGASARDLLTGAALPVGDRLTVEVAPMGSRIVVVEGAR